METEVEVDSHRQSELRAKTATRLKYEAQVNVIVNQIGDLEKIRADLGLSQRKIAQLLLIDPSSWSRWTKKGDSTPPHIYRALQWYMVLQEKVPGLNAAYFLQKDMSSLKKEIETGLANRMDQIVYNSASEIERFQDEISELKQKLKNSEDGHAKLSGKLRRQGYLLTFGVFIAIFALIFAIVLEL